MSSEIELATAPGKDVPYWRDVTWKDHEERFGEKPPYASPTQEFIENIHQPTEKDLLHRWQGMGKEVEIWSIFNSPTLIFARRRAQMIRLREAGVPDYSDPEDLRIDNAVDIEMVRALIHHNFQIIMQGFENVVESRGSLLEGFDKVEKIRHLSVISLTRLESAICDLIVKKRVLQGQAGEIVEMQKGTSKSLRDEILEAMQTAYDAGAHTGQSNGVSVHEIVDAAALPESCHES